MIKTAYDFETDFYKFIKFSKLKDVINGDVYLEGTRPYDSDKEDIIIIFSTATASQIQSGVVKVNIYFNDIDLTNVGYKVQDRERANEIAEVAQELFNSVITINGYRLRLSQAIRAYKEDKTDQHYLHINILFDYFTGD